MAMYFKHVNPMVCVIQIGMCYSDCVEIGPLYVHKKACNMVDLDPEGGPTHVKSVDWLPSVQYQWQYRFISLLLS